MRKLVIAMFLACFASQALTQVSPPPITPEEVQKAMADIKSWKGFDGVWEGTLKYQAAPVGGWSKQTIPVKVTITQGIPKVQMRVGVQDWKDLGTTYRHFQPDELTLVIHAYSAQGVWTENQVVVITRRTENTGEMWIQRSVNNWVGHPLPGEDLVYGDTRSGKVTRRPGASRRLAS